MMKNTTTTLKSNGGNKWMNSVVKQKVRPNTDANIEKNTTKMIDRRTTTNQIKDQVTEDTMTTGSTKPNHPNILGVGKMTNMTGLQMTAEAIENPTMLPVPTTQIPTQTKTGIKQLNQLQPH